MNMEIKDRIKELRESTGMNRKEFCEYFGIPYRTVTEWERGTRKMPDYVFRLLAYKIKTENFAGKEEANEESDNYICITDIAKAKTGESRSADVVKNWLRNRNTLEFLGTWEMIYNSDFKVVEFDHFKSEAGLHTFVLSVAEWINKTNAIGLYVKRGKYGGTYAHKDIAFEFASAISPVFKLYLIKEFQRLKEEENNLEQSEWNAKRFLTKNNYLIQTDAVKNYLIPKMNYRENLQWLAYAEEANPELAKKNNVRDFATINELTVLSNLESHNAQMIKEGKKKEERFKILQEIAEYQLNVLNTAEKIKMLEDENQLVEI